MMRRTTLAWILVGALMAALVGCTKPVDDKADSPGDPTPTVQNDQQGGVDDAGLDLSKVPQELRHEGFQYYGLGNSKAIEYSVERTDQESVMSGTAKTSLRAVDAGIARFITQRTGALSDLGAEEIEARKEGIFSISIGGKAVNPSQLVMPAELPVGKSWSTKSSVQIDEEQKFEESFAYKVAGTEKVKTMAGEFDTIKVTATGEIKIDGTVAKANVTAWYAKDVGAVKMSISRTEGKSGTVTMTVEATKVD